MLKFIFFCFLNSLIIFTLISTNNYKWHLPVYSTLQSQIFYISINGSYVFVAHNLRGNCIAFCFYETREIIPFDSSGTENIAVKIRYPLMCKMVLNRAMEKLIFVCLFVLSYFTAFETFNSCRSTSANFH